MYQYYVYVMVIADHQNRMINVQIGQIPRCVMNAAAVNNQAGKRAMYPETCQKRRQIHELCRVE